MNSHTDNRRVIIEFGNGGNWKLCKVIQTKEDCILGRHYHKFKEESFMLVSGSGYIKIDEREAENMELFKEYLMPINTKHEFLLTKGSILIGLCGKEFDPNDEYK